MRKTLAAVLSALMILSLLCIGVSAAEGTAIKTAEDFAAMTADGTYYLDADITLAASYGAGETPVTFTGILDGNGHTVTLSAPMFAKFSGTLKNVTLQGTITQDAKGEMGAVCALVAASSTVVVENVTTKVDMTVTYRAGGLFGQISNKSTLTMTNCVNNGKITYSAVTTDAGMIGGFVGYMQGATAVITDCVNNAEIKYGNDTSKGVTGGIIGRFGGDYPNADTYSVTFTNCLNTAPITANGKEAAGILGYGRGCTMIFKNCTNEGKITGSDAAGMIASSNVTTANDVKNTGNSNIIADKCVNKGEIVATSARGAGIGGYCWCGTGANKVATHIEITNCVNYGNITGCTYASQIFAYSNDAGNVVSGNVGLGKVISGKEGAKLSFFSFSSAAIPEALKNNVLIENDGTEYATWTTSGAEDARSILLANVDAAVVKAASKADAEKAAAALGEIGYKAPATPEQPSDPTTPDTPATPTGDSLVAVVAVAAVALFGMAVAVKKKEN